jgi:hypothetical protein
MTWSINLFIDTPVSIDDLSKELDLLLGISLSKDRSDINSTLPGDMYTYSQHYCFLTLVNEHGLENDRDMNFEDFAYELDVSVLTGQHPELSRQKCLEFASAAFNKLKETRKYKLMLTMDVQSRIDYFDPDSIRG